MAGAKGANVKAAKVYVHQEYPKVLYSDSGEQMLIKNADHEARFVANAEKKGKKWATNPSDHLPEGHPARPDTIPDEYDLDTDLEGPEIDENESEEEQAARLVGGDAAATAAKAKEEELRKAAAAAEAKGKAISKAAAAKTAQA